MSCEELSEGLSAYVDGELSLQERRDLEAHLEHCSRCHEELESLRAVSSLVGSLPAVEPSEAFTSTLTRELIARQPRRWLRPIPLFVRNLVPALAVAALVLLGVTLVFVIPMVRRPGRQAEHFEEAAEPTATPAGEVASREAAPTGPAAPTEELLAGKFAPPEAGPVAPTELKFADAAKEAEQPAIAGEALAQHLERAVATNIAKGAPLASALPREGGGEPADALEPPPHAGLIAERDRPDEMAQSRPVMSAAVRAGNEGERAALAGRAGPPEAPAEVVAKAHVALPSPRPGFHTVVLYCTDGAAGHRAFDNALQELGTLTTRLPGLATARKMTEQEGRRYSRIVWSLLESPDVITYEELRVPTSDVKLVQALFADSADLTLAEEPDDAAKLRGLLVTSRRRARAREALSLRRGGRVRGLDESRAEARVAYERQMDQRVEQELVRVILVLKRRPDSMRRAAPTLPRPAERTAP